MKQRLKRGNARGKELCKTSNLVRALTFLLASPAFLTNVAVTAIYLDASRNPKCRDCGSVDIDHMYRNIFRCLVCNKCRNEKVEKYSLLTKTECKEVTVIHLTRII